MDVEAERDILELRGLGEKIYGAILAGAGSRGGTYGEEDLRRYARYSQRAAEIYYEEFYRAEREGVEEAFSRGHEEGRMGGGV